MRGGRTHEVKDVQQEIANSVKKNKPWTARNNRCRNEDTTPPQSFLWEKEDKISEASTLPQITSSSLWLPHGTLTTSKQTNKHANKSTIQQARHCYSYCYFCGFIKSKSKHCIIFKLYLRRQHKDWQDIEPVCEILQKSATHEVEGGDAQTLRGGDAQSLYKGRFEE